MTGGRVKRLQPYIGKEPFLLTYGEGVGNVAIRKLVDFHQAHVRLSTVTATQPTGRFGALKVNDGGQVESFHEKPKGDGSWVNAGFFVLQPEIFDYIEGDHISLEKEPLEVLAKQGQLMTFKHRGFWQPMDTVRDKTHLEDLLKSGQAPWVVWKS
jgi:glucose-1-phosphate cytidylyltransferase